MWHEVGGVSEVAWVKFLPKPAVVLAQVLEKERDHEEL